jgi:hypothetical protein
LKLRLEKCLDHRMKLVWWCSRDGLTAEEFHRCDDRVNSLALIVDANEVFWWLHADDRLGSFLVVQRHPRGVFGQQVTLGKEMNTTQSITILHRI